MERQVGVWFLGVRWRPVSASAKAGLRKFFARALQAVERFRQKGLPSRHAAESSGLALESQPHRGTAWVEHAICRLLLVGSAELNPVASLLAHGVKVIDVSRVVVQDGGGAACHGWPAIP